MDPGAATRLQTLGDTTESLQTHVDDATSATTPWEDTAQDRLWGKEQDTRLVAGVTRKRVVDVQVRHKCGRFWRNTRVVETSGNMNLRIKIRIQFVKHGWMHA